MTRAIIEVRGLVKRFNTLEAVAGVSFSVAEGEVHAIIGPSGSGKSTLLRCLNWLEEPDAGSVTVAGLELKATGEPGHGPRARDLARLRASMPMVFQRFNLFAHRSVLGNVTEAQRAVLRRSKAEAEEQAVAVLTKVGLRDKLGAFPAQLSGGQQQRVAIARALAMDPRIILFDEPTSSLDPELTGEVLATIRDLAADGLTMVIVTHEMAFARQTADRISFMEGGRFIEEGTPEQLFERPRHDRTRQFLNATLA